MKKTIIFTLVGIIAITCLSGLLALEIMSSKHQKIEQEKIESQAKNLQDEADTCWIQTGNDNKIEIID